MPINYKSTLYARVTELIVHGTEPCDVPSFIFYPPHFLAYLSSHSTTSFHGLTYNFVYVFKQLMPLLH